MSKPKRKSPVRYTDDIGEELCMRIAQGESLSSVCRDDHMPHLSTVCLWTADKDHPLTEQYARARESRGDYYGYKVADVGERVLRGEVPPDVGRVAADTFRWTAGRMASKRWGDKQQHEHSGPEGGPMRVELTRGTPPDADEAG